MAEKAIKVIENLASKAFEEWLATPQTQVLAKPAKPLTKVAAKEKKIFASPMNYKGLEKKPYSDKDWFEQRLAERGGSLGKDKWGNTLIDGNLCEEPIIGFDKEGYFVVQSDEYNKIGEVAFKTLQEVEAYEAGQAKAKAEDEEIEDGEYGDHEGEQATLPIYTYDFDKTATDSNGECYLIDNYETMVDPDYPEYMTWMNKRGVAEFKTEY